MRILIVEVDAALRRFVRAAAEEETSGGALSSARTMVGLPHAPEGQIADSLRPRGRFSRTAFQ